MKKYILTLAMLMLLCLAGCNSEELNHVYSDKDDIQVEHSANDTLARITIVDTYRKNDVTYHIVKTSVSGDKEWTFSEAEYDELFGLGNDAIDCTVYKLKCTSTIHSKYFSTIIKAASHTKLGRINYDSEDISWHHGIPTTDNIKKAYGTNFDYGDFYVYAGHSNTKEYIGSTLTLKRYSFAGESDFTEEEINAYVEVMHRVNVELADRLLNK